MKNFKIAQKVIDDSSPCWIVAEIGANHDQKIDQAFKMIDAAKECGADAVKFQSYKASTLYSRYTPNRKLPDGSDSGWNIFENFKKLEMPYEWHRKLKDYSEKKGVFFFSSPFDYEAVDSLEQAGVEAYKIASSEIGDKRLVQKIASLKKPLIFSTGKATLAEVEMAVNWVKEAGNDNFAIMQCTASYPAADDVMNLRTIQTFKQAFGCVVGFSDHHLENMAAIAAISLGAKIVEKHLTLDRKLPGPDHPFAQEPEGFAQMVQWIRRTEKALGTGIKKLEPTEEQGRRLGNRSIHVLKDLPAGHVIKEEDLTVKRPAFGIHSAEWDRIIGKKITKAVKADMWLTWDDLLS